MKTVEITLYKYDELPESAKQKALESLRDINVFDDWHDSIYEDAKRIGCKIRGFDTGRGNDCDLILNDPGLDICENILKEHGPNCSTYKIASELLPEFEKAVSADDENHHEHLEETLGQQLSEEYLSMLRREYDYLTSRPQIESTILVTGYDFTEDGKIY